jgi:hypothetical protein
MEDELFTMMLVVVFVAVMLVGGQIFIDKRKRTEAATFFDSLTWTTAADMNNALSSQSGDAHHLRRDGERSAGDI